MITIFKQLTSYIREFKLPACSFP
ncbi:uncharacterized protein METZ01_LOCUS265843, partial [marine metagenome]